jgi:hypothetical protein
MSSTDKSMSDRMQMLRESLQNCATCCDVRFDVRFYDDEADFDYLWGVIERKETLEEPIAIVVHDYPRYRARNLEPWTSVDAWLLTLTKVLGTTPPHIHLLDFRKKLHAGLRDKADKNCQNWLKRYPLDPDSGTAALLNAFVDGVRAECSSHPPASTTQGSPSSKAKIFESIRKSAIMSIDQNDRHDNSNELGAMILRAGLENASSSIAYTGRERAGWILINTLLAPDTPKSISLASPINALLVDDRHDKGYADFLRQIGFESLEGWSGVFEQKSEDGDDSDTPANLLGKQIDSLKQDPDLNAFAADLLFLDLRLWRDTDRRHAAIDKYRELARSIVNGQEETTTLLKSLPENDNNSHRILSLLPVLIARLDPALPVILFSSTQHRSVTQSVRDLPNIITDFSKPYIGGSDPDEYDPETVLESLETAIRRAGRMVEFRKVWKFACKKWEGKNLTALRWDETNGWQHKPLDEAQSPLAWLRNEWLPMTQRGEYLLAAASPWLWLRRTLGDARLAILKMQNSPESHDSKALISLIEKASQAPLIQGLNAPEVPHGQDCVDKDQRELAILAAAALVELVADWTL